VCNEGLGSTPGILGRWTFHGDCDTTACSSDSPPGDDCLTDRLPIPTVGTYPTDNRCSTTDGPDEADMFIGAGDTEPEPVSTGTDIWYEYYAECDGALTVSQCDGNLYDGTLLLYSNGTSECPPCPTDDTDQYGPGGDDTCGIGGGPATLTRGGLVEGQCVLIRVGGWDGTFGVGAVTVTMEGAGCPGIVTGTPEPLAGDPSDADSGKNRYLSFSAPASATAGAAEEAIRITLDDVAGFGGFNGEVRFVGEPQEYTDEGLGTFIAAPLQCEPFFTDWSGFDLINVYGAEIVPGSSYTAQRADVSCSSLDDEGCFSDALTIETAKWGDVAPTYFAPGGPAQPDFGDISALVDKFTAAPTSPPKARAQLQPSVPKPQDAISFTDIANCIDAFTGAAFPYAGPSACP
jgi:hypothetical protein